MMSNTIKTIDDLKAHLHIAMQLEHATIPPYLTALYSIRPGFNPDAVQIIRVVAVEEMLHLTVAANLLNAIGGTPDLTVAGFVPNYPAYLPDGETDFLVHLAPFSKQTLEAFKKIERPRLAPGPQKLVKRPYPAGVTVLGTHPGASDMQYFSIGDFYIAIEDGINLLEKESNAAGKTIFVGDPERQVTSEYYYSGGGELFPVVDIESARAAIRLVMEQGEGVGGGIYDHERELSHYYRFDELTRGRYYQPEDRPENPTGPTFTVDWQAAFPIKCNLKLAEIPAGSELHNAALSFNQAYATFLEQLTQAYNGQPHLLLEAVPRMFKFRNLMGELIRNPLPDSGGFNASATFEVVCSNRVRSTLATVTAEASA
ncbi:Ferritin-like [Rhizobium tibeticum]|uniref:Ferritin-like n=1 Tax=Rhizobium tibeticum TaxID=501024 RepID=A0ABY1AY03_9HYPH|nr:ferritin-like protein [Rhizobium tibeticum]SEP29631.1 Ferritin-like [Rhizobium tibeticum]